MVLLSSRPSIRPSPGALLGRPSPCDRVHGHHGHHGPSIVMAIRLRRPQVVLPDLDGLGRHEDAAQADAQHPAPLLPDQRGGRRSPTKLHRRFLHDLWRGPSFNIFSFSFFESCLTCVACEGHRIVGNGQETLLVCSCNLESLHEFTIPNTRLSLFAQGPSVGESI